MANAMIESFVLPRVSPRFAQPTSRRTSLKVEARRGGYRAPPPALPAKVYTYKEVAGEVDAFKSTVLAANRAWADNLKAKDPEFFTTLAKGQAPEILWIGCADSRMPASDLTGKLPGEVFVHRNVANVVCHTDFNCLSVMEYAVNVLGVSHIIVCGHSQCGGVKAALGGNQVGLVDNWLRHIRDVRDKHSALLSSLPEAEAFDKMVELNVMEQVKNVCSTSIVQSAWRAGKNLTVHGWVYKLEDGLLQELGVYAQSSDAISPAYIAEPASA
jgi:carbonic anhydrase